MMKSCRHLISLTAPFRPVHLEILPLQLRSARRRKTWWNLQFDVIPTWSAGIVHRCRTIHTAASAQQDEQHPKPMKGSQDGLVLKSSHSALIDSAKLNTQLEGREKFALALKEFMAREKYRKGHVNFLKLALYRIDEFGLEKDLLTYNRILDIFPKGRFVVKRMLDALWPRPLPQTELALEILTKMEEQGVRPDYNTYMLLIEIFGKASLPVQKCYRLAYWFDEYENADPYKISGELPSDPVELSRLALQRITKNGQLIEHKVPSEEEGSYIVSASTHSQLELLQCLSEEDLSDVLLHVEGPSRIWLLKVQQFYFSLRLSGRKDEREEGPVVGVCMCHSGTQENLDVWLRALQETYPSLAAATLIYNITEAGAQTENKLLQDSSKTPISESSSTGPDS